MDFTSSSLEQPRKGDPIDRIPAYVPTRDIRLPICTTIDTQSIAFARLVRSVRSHGVILPICVRRAPQWSIVRGRINHEWRWLLISPQHIGQGPSQDGIASYKTYKGHIQHYATQGEAEKAKPSDTPYEVVAGHGRIRWAAAAHVGLNRVPTLCLSEAEVEAVCRVSHWDTRSDQG